MTAHGSVSTAFEHARRAQPRWAARPLRARLRIIRALRTGMVRCADGLVAAIDAGKARRPGETLAAELLPVLEACRFLERRAEAVLSPRQPRPYGFLTPFAGIRHEVRRDPFGVVLVIGPSNYPFMLPAIQALQALVAGNAVVVKPGAGGEAACRMLARLLERAGLPPGLCHVCRESVDEARQALAAGPDKVVLTGSARTGRAVLAELAGRITPATVELSGCDAVFVLPGADLDLVVRALRFGLTLNNGQTCISPRRLFVPCETAVGLEEKLRRAAPHFPARRVDRRAASFARELVREAEAQGARRLAGSTAEPAAWKPVMLADASPDMRLLQEDVFAPVLSVVRVSDPARALAAAARCPYALGATVFGPRERALRFARRVPAGAVVVNDMIAPTGDPRLPFGGRGRSGYGVTRGAEGLLEMTTVRAIAASAGGRRFHLEGASGLTEKLLGHYLRAAHDRGFVRRARAALNCTRAALSAIAGCRTKADEGG